MLAIRDWRFALSAARPEFIRPVTRARTRRRVTRSINYSASLRDFAPKRMGAVLDFAASWRSRATAICSGPSKESWKEESLMKREATPDSATTRFSFRKDSSKPSVNCPPKERTQSPIAPKRFARSPSGFDGLSSTTKDWEEEEPEEPALLE